MVEMTDKGALHFTKGHGTENDFVLVADLDGSGEVTAEQVRRLTDRRAGIGADGVIRVVPTRAAAEQHVRDQAPQARWFMDYRNADGSAAEMCGNGTRVFAAYLRREGLETADEFAIATRGGIKVVRFEGDLIAVNLGDWRIVDTDGAREKGFDAMVKVRGHDPMPGLSLDLGNPHTVVALLGFGRSGLAGPDPRARGPPRCAPWHQRRVRSTDRPRAHRHEGARTRRRRDPLVRHGRCRGGAGHALVGRNG